MSTCFEIVANGMVRVKKMKWKIGTSLALIGSGGLAAWHRWPCYARDIFKI